MLFVPDPAVEAEISRLEELPLNRLRYCGEKGLVLFPSARVPTSCVGAWRTSCRSARRLEVEGKPVGDLGPSARFPGVNDVSADSSVEKYKLTVDRRSCAKSA